MAARPANEEYWHPLPGRPHTPLRNARTRRYDAVYLPDQPDCQRLDVRPTRYRGRGKLCCGDSAVSSFCVSFHTLIDLTKLFTRPADVAAHAFLADTQHERDISLRKASNDLEQKACTVAR